ncbi:hypothetical protein HJFPF1_08533 [Paramyrothecium foliicola]|nr:hypothetical protein HJFPF1_08533 [Paramyrothecium foliicola]
MKSFGAIVLLLAASASAGLVPTVKYCLENGATYANFKDCVLTQMGIWNIGPNDD